MEKTDSHQYLPTGTQATSEGFSWQGEQKADVHAAMSLPGISWVTGHLIRL